MPVPRSPNRLPTKQLADVKFDSGTPRSSPYGALPQTTIRFTSDERYAAILLARYLNKIPAFEQIQGSKATLKMARRSNSSSVPTGAVSARNHGGDEDTAQLNRLADASAAGRVSATPATTAPAVTTRAAGSTDSGGAVTTAPPPPDPSSGGIIGRPPPGVPCVRY